jgi:hypothetical protein
MAAIAVAATAARKHRKYRKEGRPLAIALNHTPENTKPPAS